MRVLGVDPGLSRCGIGVVDGTGRRAVAQRVGVIRTASAAPTATRLAHLYDAVADLIADVAPDAVSVERVFFTVNVRTAMSVGQAAGVALLCAARAGIPVVEYTPTQVKAEITGHGNADKEQVAFMVKALLQLADLPGPPDAADALALALCHLRRGARNARDAGATGTDTGAAASTETGGMSPRLAAAVESATAGAQIVQRGSGSA